MSNRLEQGVTKRCRLSLLTNSAQQIGVQMRVGGGGGIAGSQPMSTAVHITWHGAQINFGDLPSYLTYGLESERDIVRALFGCAWESKSTLIYLRIWNLWFKFFKLAQCTYVGLNSITSLHWWWAFFGTDKKLLFYQSYRAATYAQKTADLRARRAYVVERLDW